MVVVVAVPASGLAGDEQQDAEPCDNGETLEAAAVDISAAPDRARSEAS